MYITSVSNASIISVIFCWESRQKVRKLPPKFYSRQKIRYLPWKSYCLSLNLLGTSCPGAATICSSAASSLACFDLLHKQSLHGQISYCQYSVKHFWQRGCCIRSPLVTKLFKSFSMRTLHTGIRKIQPLVYMESKLTPSFSNVGSLF